MAKKGKMKRIKVEEVDVDVQVIINCSFMDESIYKAKREQFAAYTPGKSSKSIRSLNVFIIYLNAKVFHLNCLKAFSDAS